MSHWRMKLLVALALLGEGSLAGAAGASEGQSAGDRERVRAATAWYLAMGVAQSSLPAIDSELLARGYSGLPRNQVLLGFGAHQPVGRFGGYVGFDVVVPDKLVSASGSMRLLQSTAAIGASWSAFQLEGFSLDPTVGAFVRQLKFGDCSGENSLCPSERVSFGLDMSVRMLLRQGRAARGAGWLLGTALGYRWEPFPSDWRNGPLENSQPKVDRSGLIGQLLVGFWIPT